MYFGFMQTREDIFQLVCAQLESPCSRPVLVQHTYIYITFATDNTWCCFVVVVVVDIDLWQIQ